MPMSSTSRPLARFAVVALLLLLPASAARAQSDAAPAVTDEIAVLLGMTEQKLVGLAEAIPEEAYDWRPAEGVRSVREVLLHVAAANYAMPIMVGQPAPEATGIGAGFEGVAAYEASVGAGKEDVVEALRASFAHVREAVRTVPADRLDETMNIFGQEGTVRTFLMVLDNHLHEHLGQLIAYARSNGVTPPWSA